VKPAGLAGALRALTRFLEDDVARPPVMMRSAWSLRDDAPGRRDEVTRYLKPARPLAGGLVFIVGLTLVAPPAFAAGPATVAAPHPIAAAAAAKVEAMPAASLAQATQAAPPRAADDETDKPFLKTTKGAIALALLAGAFGYAFYSFSHDRVKSPAK
jgi:hypothetical protein